MENRNIIVMGASAGGIEALTAIVKQLPADLDAAVFIVWHMAPDVQGVLPTLLSGLHILPATHATDREPIKKGRIYIAPPDHHLLVENDYMRITRGPKENRFRPAVDPLFRSAAFSFGYRAIGVVLSGALDDGSSGLWSIKSQGGIAIVQDPADAQVPSMPASALQAVEVDYCVPADEIASLLVKLVQEPVLSSGDKRNDGWQQLRKEVNIAEGADPKDNTVMQYGGFSPYSCPECHGVLSSLYEGELLRFRCHTGHAFSAPTLLTALAENVEASLASASRSVHERIMLLNHIGDHYAEANMPKIAAAYFQEAKDARAVADLLHEAISCFKPYSAKSEDQVSNISGISP